MDKNRLCIFSFYDKIGYVDDYVCYLLEELKSCISRIVIVVNGELDNRGKKRLSDYTDEVYLKDNVGFDAGAYKYILCQKLSEDEIKSYDEIILCNDTFYGPFIPMNNIFDKMEKSDCDMWGLNGHFDWIYPHLQSYFVVFRDRIVKSNLITDYFTENVDENTLDINHVYCRFENGLYDYMVRQKGMKCDKYIEDNQGYDVYKCNSIYLNDFHFPIAKKKIFASADKLSNDALCTLSYIKNNTDYDIKLILESVRRVYGVTVKRGEVENIDSLKLPEAEPLIVQINDVEDIEEFIKGAEFYIYGAGKYACNTYWRFARGNDKFLGFVVSDDSKDANTLLFGQPVKRFSDVEDICSKKVILGMKAEFALEVLKQFSDTSNVIRIF